MFQTIKVAKAIKEVDGKEVVCHNITASIEFDDETFKPNPMDIEILREMVGELNAGYCPECGAEIERFELENTEDQIAKVS